MLSPDSALLGGSERISVPLAGPVSFFRFILLGPVLLIVLRVYLQVYVAQATGGTSSHGQCRSRERQRWYRSSIRCPAAHVATAH